MAALVCSNSAGSEPRSSNINVASPEFNSLGDLEGVVLCVDDNLIIRALFRRLVTKLAFRGELVFAVNGQEALEIYRNRNAQISMIFMDIQMPKMDGLLATKKIRALEVNKGLPPVPIVCISSLAQERAADWKKAGMSFGAGKPLTAGKILLAFHALLRDKESVHKQDSLTKKVVSATVL